MLFDKLVTIALTALSLFLFPGTAIGNALSEAYSLAFVEPRKFETLLRFKVKDDAHYLEKFSTCFKLAIPTLNAMENQDRERHRSCRDNRECSQVAKDIQTVLNLRLKVRDLDKYVRATQKTPAPEFLTSDIGRMAMSQLAFHEKMGIDIRKNPELVREIGVLHSLSCP